MLYSRSKMLAPGSIQFAIGSPAPTVLRDIWGHERLPTDGWKTPSLRAHPRTRNGNPTAPRAGKLPDGSSGAFAYSAGTKLNDTPGSRLLIWIAIVFTASAEAEPTAIFAPFVFPADAPPLAWNVVRTMLLMPGP